MIEELYERKQYLLEQFRRLQETAEFFVEGEEFNLASIYHSDMHDILNKLNTIANEIADLED